MKIAIPNKGQLAEPAMAMLREAGYHVGSPTKNLVVVDRANGVEFFFLRPKDIAVYVAKGTLDLGITGQDMVIDSSAKVTELLRLGFGKAFFALAGKNSKITLSELNGTRIATSYSGLLSKWLDDQIITAEIIKLDGAVENAVQLGVADYVADVVATGSTLQLAGLTVVGDPIMQSEAVLVAREGFSSSEETDRFIRRLSSVIVARDYVLMDYDIETASIAQACEITPGFESPTISALRDPAWSAIRVMVPAANVHQIMDDLYLIGAKGILVTEIAACRL